MSTDIIKSSILAYMNAINHMESRRKRPEWQHCLIKSGTATYWQAKKEKRSLYVDGHLIHEVTSAPGVFGAASDRTKTRRPDLTYAVMDHNTPTTKKERENITDTVSKKQFGRAVAKTATNSAVLYDMDSEDNAIIHMMGPNWACPCRGKSSYAATVTPPHTALGRSPADGTSEVEHVFATQTLWQAKPKISAYVFVAAFRAVCMPRI